MFSLFKKASKKWGKWTIIVLSSGMILSAIAIHFVLPYSIIRPFRQVASEIPERFPNGLAPSDYGLSYQTLAIETKDSLKLKGYFIPTTEAVPKGTLILFHGISGCKEHRLNEAVHWAKKGWNTVIFDSRAHGESEGLYCTYGYFEKEDVSRILDHLDTEIAAKPYAVSGISMGGAVALQAMASDPRIDFGLVESTFTGLERIVFEYQKRLAYIGVRPITNYILGLSGEIAHFDPSQVKPAEAARSIHQPILMVHGTEDKHITPDHGLEIFENLSSIDKEFHWVKGAHHHNLHWAGGQEYLHKTEAFMERMAQKFSFENSEAN